MDMDFSELDLQLVMYDFNDTEEERCDNVVAGVAIRAEDAEAFAADVERLAVEKYGGATFAGLLDEDLDDESMAAACRFRNAKRNEDLLAEAEEALEKALPDPQDMPEGEDPAATVADAVRYSVMAGGKRLRPLLIARVSDIYGGRRELAEPFMAALEMIHTYSLIHDDLPAMDNDEFRRGRRTTHIVYGEGMAILAGDGLLNYAYETALQAFRHTEDVQRVAGALQILSSETGLYGMLGGQSVDVQNDKNGVSALSKEELDYIYLHKTGSLLEAPLMIGATLAGAGKGEIGCMKEIGRRIGLAFQIQDDILDVTATTEELGKPVGSDTKNDKTTDVTLMGVDRARETVEEQTAVAVRLLESMPGEKEFLRELLVHMASRSK